jgi:hypothetical protein
VPDPTPSPRSDERGGLRDTFERLAAEESQRASTPCTYDDAVGTDPITTLVVTPTNLPSPALLRGVIVTFLAGLGILISLVEVVLLDRPEADLPTEGIVRFFRAYKRGRVNDRTKRRTAAGSGVRRGALNRVAPAWVSVKPVPLLGPRWRREPGDRRPRRHLPARRARSSGD